MASTSKIRSFDHKIIKFKTVLINILGIVISLSVAVPLSLIKALVAKWFELYFPKHEIIVEAVQEYILHSSRC